MTPRDTKCTVRYEKKAILRHILEDGVIFALVLLLGSAIVYVIVGISEATCNN